MRQQRVEDILEVLCCPVCHGGLSLRGASGKWALPKITLSQSSLYCQDCAEEYPITEEGIPILWTPEIRAFLGGRHSDAALSANIDVYDEISDHYLVHVRKSDDARDRFMACVEAVEPARLESGWHIDFGCGPGNVLAWTKEWAKANGIRQIGLDVSIQNLRNVLAKTDAYAVLGDAIKMPFKDNCAGLLTEASVLHHIEDWRASILEASRITKTSGAIIFDNEPTKKALDLSPLARTVFESRFIVYKVLSYFVPRRRSFRNMKLSKLNYYNAEVHNQPGRGFDPEEVRTAFEAAGRGCTLYFRMGSTLGSGTGANSRQRNFLLWLSGKDLSDPEYGIMTLIS